MNEQERLKILKQLSVTRGEKAQAALEAEFGKAAEILAKGSDFSTLSQSLAELSVYAFRVHNKAMEVASSFLRRLRDSDFITHQSDSSILSADLGKLRLALQAVKAVEGLRYLDMQGALEVLCEFSVTKDEQQKKSITESLEKCAGYNIDVYYPCENHPGLQERPQLQVIGFLEARSDAWKQAHLDAVTTLSRELLSPTMEGTSSDYSTLTWSTSSIPATEEIASIRSRTVELLKKLYRPSMEEGERRLIIRTVFGAMELPRNNEIDENVLGMVEADALRVLAWLKSIVTAESFPVRQTLEHDVYWRFYHAETNAMRAAALAIRDELLQDSEFLIYRTLIGFESIYEDWENSILKKRDYREIESERTDQALRYVRSISHQNWFDWRGRIFTFCQVRANDLATFPIFYDFLGHLAVAHPKFGYELVSEHLEKMQGFTIPLYRALWSGPHRQNLKSLLLRRATAGEDLLAISRLFQTMDQADQKILDGVLKVALRNSDEIILSQLIAVAAKHYENDYTYFVGELFSTAISKLSYVASTDWVDRIWINSEFQSFVAHLDPAQQDVLLKALIPIERVSSQIEAVLKAVAKQRPEAVVDFFHDRTKHNSGASHYEAIPYRFHALPKQLSKFPEVLVKRVRRWFKTDRSLFEYRGGMFLANIFPSFEKAFEAALVPYARSTDTNDVSFVIGIMRNYKGQPFVHDICREIILKHHNDVSVMREVEIVLLSEGVVTGEFGLAESKAKKADEIRHWLDDKNEVVRDFAREYVDQLRRREKEERARAEQGIALRKHIYGDSKTA